MSGVVTATEGGSTTNGISLLVKVVTGEAASPIGITQAATNSTPSLSTGTGVSTGSFVYGALVGLTTITANGSTTFENNHNGGGLQYVAMKATSATTAGTAVTVGGTGGTGISICLLEILAGTGLAEDASSPAGVFAGAAITVSTASFSPPAGSVLVAMVSCNGGASVTTMSVTDTLGLGLTWTQQVHQDTAGDGYSGIFTAPVPYLTIPPLQNGVTTRGRRGVRGRSLGSPAPLPHIEDVPPVTSGAAVRGRQARRGLSLGSSPITVAAPSPAIPAPARGAAVKGRRARGGASSGSPVLPWKSGGPMSAAYVALTVDEVDGTAAPVSSGTVTFTPSVALTDPVDGMNVVAPVSAGFRPGQFPVVHLLATDSTGPMPAGWGWTVTFSGVPGNPASFTFKLPYSLGAAQRLSAQTPATSVVSTFPVNPMTAAGDMISGAASPPGTPQRLPIGAPGDVMTVINGQPAWAAASGSVSSVFGRTGAVAAASGDYTVSQVTGAAPLASPTFTGTPAAPTASALDDSTKLATTAYADAAVAVETSRAQAAETARLAKSANLSDVASQQTALDNLAGAVTSGEYLRGDGSHVQMSPILLTDLGAAGTGTTTSVNAPLLYGAVWGYKYKFYADSYGALGNGKAVTDMAMTSSSATLACTSSSPFASGDTGKAVLVSTAKGAYSPLRATISGFTDSAHVTLSASATSSTTGTPGAIGWFGTDDTSALQSQLNAAYTYMLAHGYAEVLLDPTLMYIADGSFLTSASGNAQITLPAASTTAVCGELVLDGGGGAAPLMHWLQLAPEVAGGAVIASTRIDGTATGGGSNGPSFIIGGPVNGFGGEPGTFSNILIRVKGLGTLSPYNSTVGGLGLFGILEADVESYSHMTGAVVPSSSAPSPTLSTPGNISNQWAYGLQMPCAGNQVVCRVGQFRCEGMCYGIGLSEWSHAQQGHGMYCVGAVGLFSGNGVSMVHEARIDMMQAENCTNAVIAVDVGLKRMRASISTESISGTAHVYDPSNLIYGDVDFFPQGGAGSSINFANGGGLNLRMRNMMTPPGTVGPPSVPGSTTPYTNYYGRNAMVYITSGGAAVSAIAVTTPGGTSITTGATLGSTGTVQVPVPIGYSITLTYASTAPTWVWAVD